MVYFEGHHWFKYSNEFLLVRILEHILTMFFLLQSIIEINHTAYKRLPSEYKCIHDDMTFIFNGSMVSWSFCCEGFA